MPKILTSPTKNAREVVNPQEIEMEWTFNLLDEILEKNRNRKKYYHCLKEHPKLAKFGCKML